MNDTPDRRLERRLRALEQAIPVDRQLQEAAVPPATDRPRIAIRTALPSLWPLLAAVGLVAVLAGGALVGGRALTPAATQSPTPQSTSIVAVSPSAEPTAPATPTVTPIATPTVTPVPSPTISPVPSPTVTPIPSPTISPVPSPSATGGWACSTATVIPSTMKGYEPAQIADVRVGSHEGYDRIVFEFAGTGTPVVRVEPVVPPFVTDGAGLPLTVPGSVFLKITLSTATGYPTYTGPLSFDPGFPRLTSLVRAGDWEGYVSWIAGLSGPSCYAVSVMSDRSRVVIDVQAP